MEDLELMINELDENKPLYKDSGSWQIRSDDMDDVLFEQHTNESFHQFIKRVYDTQKPWERFWD